jgi:hypothetical protein
LMPLVAFPDNPSSFLWLTAAVPKHAGLPPRGYRSMRPQRFFSSGLARYALCSSGPAPAVCSSFMTTQRPLLSSLKNRARKVVPHPAAVHRSPASCAACLIRMKERNRPLLIPPPPRLSSWPSPV